ncbi:MAG: hypothetical protein ACK5MG_10065 [Bacteroidales bacterium]
MSRTKRRIKHLRLRLTLLYARLQNFFSRLHRTNRSKRIAFSICLVVATLAWLLNALNKTSSYTVVFDLKYTSVPKEMGVSEGTPKQVHAELSGSGYRLFFLMLGVNNNLEISLNRFTSKSFSNVDEQGVVEVNVPKHLFFEMFGKRIGSDMTINRLYPESLNVYLDSIVSKDVPIMPHVDVSFKNKFNSYGQAFTVPRVITATGLKANLDTINIINTEYQVYKDLSQTTERLIRLTQIEGVKFSERTVRIIIPVREYTENSVNVDIVVRNVPEGETVVVFPAKAEVKFKASVDDIANVRDDDFEAYVNYSQLGLMKSVPVTLEVNNDRLKNVELATPYINYMIKEN